MYLGREFTQYKAEVEGMANCVFMPFVVGFSGGFGPSAIQVCDLLKPHARNIQGTEVRSKRSKSKAKRTIFCDAHSGSVDKYNSNSNGKCHGKCNDKHVSFPEASFALFDELRHEFP